MELLNEDFRIDNSFSEDETAKENDEEKNPLIKFGFSEEQAQYIRKLGFHRLTQIEMQTLPVILSGESAIIISRTGSGKTLAFCLPILKLLHAHKNVAGIRAVILAPTRELAYQISRVLMRLAGYLSEEERLKIALLSGGDSLDAQFEQLSGNPDVIVATPGRLLFHLEQIKHLKDLLQTVNYLVIDESDEMFENQLLPEVSDIIAVLQKPQTILCSATMPEQLSDFALSNITNYKLIQSEIETLPDELAQLHLVVPDTEKAAALVLLLKNMPKTWKTLIFVSTRYHAEYLLAIIGEVKIKCQALYGNLDQQARHEILDEFSSNVTNILIATDVAARGIDIDNLECVINFNFPFSARTYLHRGGRCARAGNYGVYINLLAHDEVPYLLDALLHAGLKCVTASPLLQLERLRRKYMAYNLDITGVLMDSAFDHLADDLRRFITEYANTNEKELTRGEDPETVRNGFVLLYRDTKQVVAQLSADDFKFIRTYLFFASNCRKLGLSPYELQAFLGVQAEHISSVIGALPQQLLDHQQSLISYDDVAVQQAEKPMKNSIQQLKKQMKSASFNSCERAQEMLHDLAIHPLYEEYIRTDNLSLQAELQLIQSFKVPTLELAQLAKTGDESARVQLKMRELVEKKKLLEREVQKEILKSEQKEVLKEGNSVEVLRALDEKVRQASSNKQDLLVAEKPTVKQNTITDIILDTQRDEVLTDGVQKKVWDKVKGRWVSLASMAPRKDEKNAYTQQKDGKWKKVEKDKQFYDKWVKKSGMKVGKVGELEEKGAKKLKGVRVITNQDKDRLEKELGQKLKKKDSKASRISKVAQNAAEKGKDWRKEADKRRAKGKKIDDNKWRKAIKRNK